MDHFKLLRDFWDFAFDNPEKISPNHCALYCFIINHSNRLGRKPKLGLPTEMTKEAIGMKSYKTYIKTLMDLVDWGFIEMLEKSKNQYSSNIIALVNFTEATTKAYDKAMLMQQLKQVKSNDQSNDQSNSQSNASIDELITNKEELITNLEKNKILIDLVLEDQEWCEVTCMQSKIEMSSLKSWLDKFNLELIQTFEKKYSKKDFASHFTRWLRIELLKSKQNYGKPITEPKPAYMLKPCT